MDYIPNGFSNQIKHHVHHLPRERAAASSLFSTTSPYSSAPAQDDGESTK